MEVITYCFESLIEKVKTCQIKSPVDFESIVKMKLNLDIAWSDFIIDNSRKLAGVTISEEVRKSDLKCVNDTQEIQLKPPCMKERTVIIHGLKVLNVENLTKTVSSLFSDGLKLNLEFDSIRLLGSNNGVYTVLVVMKSMKDKAKLFRSCSRLKNSEYMVSITDDLDLNERKLKASQLRAFKDARAHGKKAYFKGTSLVVKDEAKENTSKIGRCTK
jgi:hypothetical protein